jgi:hypothetical protein
LGRFIKLYEKHEALRDRFVLLAFHDNRAKTFEELDPKMTRLSEKRWEGKTLPFPILLDSTGATVKAYGISSFPTYVLIDPDGKVVKGKGDEILKKMVAEWAEAEKEAR